MDTIVENGYGKAKISDSELERIFDLIENSSLTFSEIAGEVEVSATVISKINQGELHRSDKQYPVRNEDFVLTLRIILDYFRKGIIKDIPSIDYRKEHSIKELAEHCSIQDAYNIIHSIGYINHRSARALAKTKLNKNISKDGKATLINLELVRCRECGNILSNGSKGLCQQCYNKQREASIRIPKEDISLDLIAKILDTSLESVAKEYGYSSGNAIKKALRKYNMPANRDEMYRYYEKETGHKHPKESKEKRKKKAKAEHKRLTRGRKIGQFDCETMEMVARFPSTRDATRKTGVPNSNIVTCCNGKLKKAGNYVWRYLNQDDNPIAPDDLSSYKWNLSCEVCGRDTESSKSTICPHCKERRENLPKELTLEHLIDLLHDYPFAQLARLLNTCGKTLFSRFERLGMSKEEVKKLNAENNSRRKESKD